MYFVILKDILMFAFVGFPTHTQGLLSNEGK